MGSFFLHLHRSEIRCLSHSTVLSIVIVSAIGTKALPNQTTTLSSEFKRGHRKTTKGVINVNRTLRLKTGFHQKAMRSQTENRIKRTVLHKSMQSDWGTALKTGLISLLFLLLRSYDANLRQNFKRYLCAKWRKIKHWEMYDVHREDNPKPQEHSTQKSNYHLCCWKLWHQSIRTRYP